MKCRVWLSLLGLLAAGMFSNAFAQSTAPFRIGVAPHTSARVIIEMYQPLRTYLEQSLKRPVEIVTAGDFTEFARRATQQQYDLAITTGHQARLLETDFAYSPLLTYKADFKAVALVEKNNPAQEAKDLAGAQVIGLSPSSLVTIWGVHWLHRNNIPNTQMRFVSASDSVAQLLISGEGSVGFASLANYQNLPPAMQARLRIFAESLPLAGRVYVLNKKNAALKEKIETALWAFAETPEAQQYFRKYKLDGYRKLEPRELLQMEPYANEVRQTLKEKK
jgi:phosphonate transport system substrate-binding protein